MEAWKFLKELQDKIDKSLQSANNNNNTSYDKYSCQSLNTA